MARNRDFAILVISTIAILLSLESSTDLKVQVSWYLESKTVQGLETLPPPIVTDLDGDGENEVVFITADYHLQVLSIPSQSALVKADSMTQPIFKAQANLLPGVRISQGRAPIALGHGYLDPYDASDLASGGGGGGGGDGGGGGAGRRRRQVACAVHADWRVACYGGEPGGGEEGFGLALLWEVSARPPPPAGSGGGGGSGGLALAEAAVLVAPHRARAGDRGLVVVAGKRAGPRGRGVGLEGGMEPERIDPAAMASLPRSKEDAEHFDLVALEGGSGALRWRHTSRGGEGNEGAEDPLGGGGGGGSSDPATAAKRQELLDTHQFKVGELRTRDWGAAGGWLRHRRSMLRSALPHAHFGPQDAYLALAHFARDNPGKPKVKGKGKNKKGKRAGSSQDSGAGGGGGGGAVAAAAAARRALAAAAVPRGARRPHLEAEHLAAPNVVLAHSLRGVEAVALLTGRPVAALALAPEITYADLNGDGVLDQARGSTAPAAHCEACVPPCSSPGQGSLRFVYSHGAGRGSEGWGRPHPTPPHAPFVLKRSSSSGARRKVKTGEKRRGGGRTKLVGTLDPRLLFFFFPRVFLPSAAHPAARQVHLTSRRRRGPPGLGAAAEGAGGDAAAGLAAALGTPPHADLLADARLAALRARAAHPRGGLGLPRCHALVLSGLPARDALSAPGLCAASPLSDATHKKLEEAAAGGPAGGGGSGRRRGRSSGQAGVEGVDIEADVAPPLTVPAAAGGGGGGRRDLVFATSSGVLSCHTPEGELNWAVRRAPTWNKVLGQGFLMQMQVESQELLDTLQYPDSSKQGKILIAGDREFAIYSSSGSREGTGMYPKSPVQRPIIGDFNNDGINDVIMVFEDAILGYSIQTVLKTRFLLVLVSLVLIVLVVTVLFANNNAEFALNQGGRKNKKGRKSDHPYTVSGSGNDGGTTQRVRATDYTTYDD